MEKEWTKINLSNMFLRRDLEQLHLVHHQDRCVHHVCVARCVEDDDIRKVRLERALRVAFHVDGEGADALRDAARLAGRHARRA